MSQQTVTLTETVTVAQHEVSDDEKRNAAEYNQLVREAIRYARHQLKHGSPATKLAIAKSVLPAASRLSAIDAKEGLIEHRVALQNVVSKMLNVPAIQEELAHDAAPVETVSRRVVDQDDDDGST